MVSEEEYRGLTAADDGVLNYGAAVSNLPIDPDGHIFDEEGEEGPASDANEDGENVQEARENDGEIAVAALTARLRCLLRVITWPIVPLGAILILSFIWMGYAAFIRDIHSPCSHPLHWYAGASIVLLCYTPYHTVFRSFLFQYRRDRDGPNRPPNARRCDQVFHTIALLYVYAGITLLQTCRGDLQGEEGAESSSCSVTCPALYQALSVYVVSLEVFTFSLILPLLFLPCLYFWLIRQAAFDGEALAILQERLRDDEIFFQNGHVTSSEIMSQLESVLLVSDPVSDRVLIVPVDDKDLVNAKDSNGVECCICMNDFSILSSLDEETGDATQGDDEAIVRTHCGHVMHQRCMASWVDGRWQSSDQQQRETSSDAAARRARRTTCPLCRTDLRS